MADSVCRRRLGDGDSENHALIDDDQPRSSMRTRRPRPPPPPPPPSLPSPSRPHKAVLLQAGVDFARARIHLAQQQQQSRRRHPRGPWRGRGPVTFEGDGSSSSDSDSNVVGDSKQEHTSAGVTSNRTVRFLQPISYGQSHAHFMSVREEEALRAKRRAILDEQKYRDAEVDDTVEDYKMYSDYDEDLRWRLSRTNQQ